MPSASSDSRIQKAATTSKRALEQAAANASRDINAYKFRYYGELLADIRANSPKGGQRVSGKGGKGGVGKTLTIAALAELDHFATSKDTCIVDGNKAQPTLPDRVNIELDDDLVMLTDIAEIMKLLIQVDHNLRLNPRDPTAKVSIDKATDIEKFFIHAEELKELAHYTASQLMVVPHGMSSNRHFDIRTVLAALQLIKRCVHSMFMDTGNEPIDVFNEAIARFTDVDYYVCLADDNSTAKTMLDTMRVYYGRGYRNGVRNARVCYSKTEKKDTPETLYRILLNYAEEPELKELGFDGDLSKKIYLLPKNKRLGGTPNSSFDPFSFSPLLPNSVDINPDFVGIDFAIAVAEFRLALLKHAPLTDEQKEADITAANEKIHEFNEEISGSRKEESTMPVNLDELIARLLILPPDAESRLMAAIEQ